MLTFLPVSEHTETDHIAPRNNRCYTNKIELNITTEIKYKLTKWCYQFKSLKVSSVLFLLIYQNAWNANTMSKNKSLNVNTRDKYSHTKSWQFMEINVHALTRLAACPHEAPQIPPHSPVGCSQAHPCTALCSPCRKPSIQSPELPQ